MYRPSKQLISLAIFLLLTPLLMPPVYGGVVQGGQATRIRYGPSLPSVCTANTDYFSLNGDGLYWCSATDTWSKVDSSSGGTITGSGNPGEVAIWSATTSLTGDSELIFSTTTNTLTTPNIVGSSSITDSALTQTRVTFAGTAGLLVDDSDFTFTSGNTLNTQNLVISGTCTGCGTATIMGSIGTSQIAFGSGVDTITGSSSFIHDLTDASNRYGIFMDDITGATANYAIKTGKGQFDMLNSAVPETGVVFYNGGKSGQNYEARFGQRSSGADDPLGFFDFWVHDDMSASYTTSVNGAHQYAFRGTKIVADNRSGEFGGVHGTVGVGTGLSGTTIGRILAVKGEADYSGNISGAVGELGGMYGIATAGNGATPVGTITQMWGVAGQIDEVSPSAVITNISALRAMSTDASGATVTNNYGLKVENQAVNGANNYAIYTEAGSVRFAALSSGSTSVVTADSNGVLGITTASNSATATQIVYGTGSGFSSTSAFTITTPTSAEYHAGSGVTLSTTTGHGHAFIGPSFFNIVNPSSANTQVGLAVNTVTNNGTNTANIGIAVESRHNTGSIAVVIPSSVAGTLNGGSVSASVQGIPVSITLNSNATANQAYGVTALVTVNSTAQVSGSTYGFVSNFVTTGSSQTNSMYGYTFAQTKGGSSTVNGTVYAYHSDELASTLAANVYYLWFDSDGVYRIREDTTFNSVGQAIPTLYNPQFVPKYTAGATAYERCIPGCQWNSNVAEVAVESAGSGTLRTMRFRANAYEFLNATTGYPTITHGTVVMAGSTAIQTTTTSGDTFQLQGYDTDNTLYRSLLTVQAGTIPTLTITAQSGAQNLVQIVATTYGTAANCADSAGAAACGFAAAGHVVIDAATTGVVVSTTAVTGSTQILITEDVSAAARLGITCNQAAGRTYRIVSRTNGVSFTIASSAAPVTVPACIGYFLVNP